MRRKNVPSIQPGWLAGARISGQTGRQAGASASASASSTTSAGTTRATKSSKVGTATRFIFSFLSSCCANNSSTDEATDTCSSGYEATKSDDPCSRPSVEAGSSFLPSYLPFSHSTTRQVLEKRAFSQSLSLSSSSSPTPEFNSTSSEEFGHLLVSRRDRR